MSSLFIRNRNLRYYLYIEYKEGGRNKQKLICSSRNKEEMYVKLEELRLDSDFITKYELKENHFSTKYSQTENSENKYYVYKFLSKEGTAIYVGYTNNINDRIINHGHLPDSCYKEICKIQYIELDREIDAKILELYFINKYNSKYNVHDKYNSGTTLEIINIVWKDFDLDLLKFYYSCNSF